MGGDITQGLNMLYIYIDPWEDQPEKWPANFRVCVRSFQRKLSKATLPFATFMANDPQGPQTTRCWWMAVKPCHCLVYLIVFGIISNQNNHFNSTFRIFRIPVISNMFVLPCSFHHINLVKKSRTFLGPWVLHHLSWLYKQQAPCVPMGVMGRSVDGMLGF